MASKVSGVIEKIQTGGSNGTIHAIASTAYGYCETAASEQYKNVDMTGFKLEEGVTIHVKFANTNSASNPKLKFNGEENTEAKSIIQYGTTTASWDSGAVLTLTYDGTDWIRDQDTNNKVSQTAVGNTYTNWRPLLIGASSSATEGFSPASTTDGAYTTSSITVQPSTGTIRATTFKGNLIGNATSASGANTLIMTSVDNTTLHNTSGTFAFSGSGTPWSGYDWVGLQVGSGNDKFQIVGTIDNNSLLFRNNDSGGTNTSWGSWQMVAHSTRGTQVGNSTQPVYMTAAGVITAGTALKALAYEDSLTYSDVGAAASNHNHNADDINAGTLNTARLPDDVVKKRTGLSTSTTETDLFSLIPGMYDHTSSGVDNALPTGYGTILNIAGSYYYGALIAAETNNSLYYRAYYYQDDEHEQWRGNWQMVAHTDAATAMGNAKKPIYINAKGEIQEGDALKNLAYKDSLTSSDIPDNAANTTGNAATSTSAKYLYPFSDGTNVSGTTNVQILQAIQNSDDTPRSVPFGVKLQHGNTEVGFGYFYPKTALYGGWYIASYGGPSYVAVTNGTWETYRILTSNNTAVGNNNAATLTWNTTYTIAKINGTDIKFTTMAKPSYAFTDLTAHPTTLGGYGITDAASSGHSHTLKIGNKSLSVSTSEQTWDVHDILYNSSSSIETTTSWDITTPGIYTVTTGSHTGSGHPGSTTGEITPYAYGHLIVTRAGNSGAAQIYISHTASGSTQAKNGIRYRSGWDVKNENKTEAQRWQTWATILDDKNYSLFAWKRPASITTGEVLISDGDTGATTLRAITDNTTANTTITASTNLITANTLANWNGAYNSTNSNLSILGTISTGTWQADTIETTYGGTGKTSWTQWGIVYASATDTLDQVTAGAADNSGLALISNGAAAPGWYGGLSLTGTAAASWKANFLGTTDASSTTTAAVTITGGLGVAKTLYVGTQAIIAKIKIGNGTTDAQQHTITVTDNDLIFDAPSSKGFIFQQNATTKIRIVDYTCYPEASTSSSLGITGKRWETAYLTTSLLVGANSTGVNYNTNGLISFIGPGVISSCVTTAGNGYYLIGGGTQYGRWFIKTIGTANNGTTQGTQGEAVLEVGNSTPLILNASTGGAHNSRGIIRIYGTNAYHTDILAQANGDNSCYLPNYDNDMFLVHAGDNQAIGSGKKPVYVAENGRVTVCNTKVGDPYTPIYANNGEFTATSPIQYFTWSISSGKYGVSMTDNDEIFKANTYSITLVVLTGESNLNAPLTWTSGNGTFSISTAAAVSGDVTGYAIIARGANITNSITFTQKDSNT